MLAGASLAILALAAPFAARAADSNTIGDVVVTATKTGATSLQKTPISVSVVGDQSLETDHAVTLKDLPSEVTALKITNANANVVVYIRGVGGYASNNEQDVGVYMDGVYMGRTSSVFDSNFNDLERVEVAKGPQGTTFGRNSVGGALNFITKQPSTTFQFENTLNLGNYNLIDEAAHISGPITDKLQASASIGYTKHDGYIQDVVAGVPAIGGQNRVNFRGQLKYEFNNDITNLIRVDYLYTHEDYAINSTNYISTTDPRYLSCGTTAASCASAAFPAPLADAKIGNYHYYGAAAPQITSELDYGINDELNWKLNDNISFKNLLAYRTDQNLAFYSGNGTEYMTGATATLYFQHQFSDELTMAHTFGNLKGVVGLYGWTEFEHQIGDSISYTYPSANPTSTYYYATYAPGYNTKINGTESYQDTRFPTQSYAIYANETYQLTKDVGIIFGGRYTQEHKVLDTYNTSFIWNGGLPAGWYGSNPAAPGSRGTTSANTINTYSCSCSLNGQTNPLTSTIFPFVLGYGGYNGPGSVSPDLTQTISAFTPKLGIQWQATDNAFLYFTATRGFKSGGFSFTARNAFGATFQPEWITTYEVGAKTDWLDKKLRINVAVFRNDWTNLQVNSQTLLPNTTLPLTEASNAAGARETGLDADVTWKPWDGWTFTSSVTWLPDAIYTSYTSGQPTNFIKQLMIQNGDPKFNPVLSIYNASGNRLMNAPDVTANVTGQKDFDIGNGNTLFVRGELNYTGSTSFDISDYALGVRNPFGYGNLSAGYSSAGGHYQVELWGRNVTNVQYADTLLPGSKIPQAIPGAPATFGVRLNYTY